VLDAVLGAPPGLDPSRLTEFRAGGPTGRLSEDIKATIAAVLDSKDADPEVMERVRRLIASDARLHKAMHDKFEKLTTFLGEAIVEREGRASIRFERE
jgi:hypothetical protein